MSKDQQFSKILPQRKRVYYSNNYTTNTRQEISIGQSVVEPGDFVESGIINFDFDIINKDAKLFIVINCKVYLYDFNIDSITHENENNNTKSDSNNFKRYSKEQVKYSGMFTGI